MRIVALAAVILTGCISTNYVRDGATDDDLSRDWGACAHEANTALALVFWDRRSRAQKMIDECMSARGYREGA